MKKSSIIILLLSVFLLVGCEKKETIKSNGKKVDTSKMVHKYCTREGTVENGTASLSYDLYYTGDILNLLKSTESVTSQSSKVLDTYEEAYKKIHSHYEDVKYYDTEVIRNDDTVTSIITINYDKIDIDKLISIEGEEDNIFEKKKAKVSKWLTLAKKFGTKCQIVEE